MPLKGFPSLCAKHAPCIISKEETGMAYLIELKGSDLVKAAGQLEASAKVLNRFLSGYQMQYRNIAN